MHAGNYLGGEQVLPLRHANSPLLSLKVKLWYDKVGHQLIVTILGAKDLLAREDGRPRNPYVKIYFLPDRRCKEFLGSCPRNLSRYICSNIFMLKYHLYLLFISVISMDSGPVAGLIEANPNRKCYP